MSSLLPLFARHRWTGCKSTLQRAAIVFSWCNLGVEVIPAWIQRSLSSTVCKELTFKGAQDITAGAAALQDGYDSDVEDQARLDQKHAAALASSAEVTNTAISLITGSYDWAEHNKTLKCDAAKWAAGDPSGILLVINIGVDAFVRLMHAYLTVSSEKWLKDEAAAAAREGRPPRLRVSVAYQCREEDLCAREVFDLMIGATDKWRLLPEKHRTLTNRSIAFCMLSRGICGAYGYLYEHQKDYPQKFLHACAVGCHTLMQEVVREGCRHDEYVAAKVKEAKKSPQALLERLNRAKTTCYAGMWELDIAAIECRNGHAQRYARTRSLHVTPLDAIFASAFFTVDRERQRSRHHWIVPPEPTSEEAPCPAPESGRPAKKHQKTKPVSKQSAKRWGWYTFVSESSHDSSMRNKQHGDVFEGVGAQYREVKNNPGKYLQLLDRAADYRDAAAQHRTSPFQRHVQLPSAVAESLRALTDDASTAAATGAVAIGDVVPAQAATDGNNARLVSTSGGETVQFEADMAAQLTAIRSANRKTKKERRLHEQSELLQLQKWKAEMAQHVSNNTCLASIGPRPKRPAPRLVRVELRFHR